MSQTKYQRISAAWRHSGGWKHLMQLCYSIAKEEHQSRYDYLPETTRESIFWPTYVKLIPHYGEVPGIAVPDQYDDGFIEVFIKESDLTTTEIVAEQPTAAPASEKPKPKKNNKPKKPRSFREDLEWASNHIGDEEITRNEAPSSRAWELKDYGEQPNNRSSFWTMCDKRMGAAEGEEGGEQKKIKADLGRFEELLIQINEELDAEE